MSALIDRLPIDTVDAATWDRGSDRRGPWRTRRGARARGRVRGRSLPIDVDDALARFASQSNRAGALLIRNVPIGALPPTPATPSESTGKDLATELTLLTVGAPPGRAGRLRPRARRTHRAEHRADAPRRRPSDLHVVAVDAHVPHRDGVPPVPPALPAAALSPWRPGSRDDDGQRARRVRRAAGGDRRGDVRTAIPHGRRRELPRRPIQRARPDHGAGDRHDRLADVRVRRRPHGRHRSGGAARGRRRARHARTMPDAPSCSSPATCS